MPPVAGPKGAQYQPLWDPISQLSGFSFAIFDTNENPVATYRLADFLWSEYNMFINHGGIEGVGWDPPANLNAKNIEGAPLKMTRGTLPSDATDEETFVWNQNRFWFALIGDIRERRAMWTPQATEETRMNQYEVYLHYETAKTEPYWPEVRLPRLLFMQKDLAEEFAELKTNIVSQVIKNTGLFITGSRPMDEWDAYISELNRFGVERYVEIYSGAYDTFRAMMK